MSGDRKRHREPRDDGGDAPPLRPRSGGAFIPRYHPHGIPPPRYIPGGGGPKGFSGGKGGPKGGPPPRYRFGAAGPPPAKVDRQRACPFLLRVYTTKGRYRTASDFAVDESGLAGFVGESTARGKAEQEKALDFSTYCWDDTTLKELMWTVQGHCADAARPRAHLRFAILAPDRESGELKVREVGMTRSRQPTRPDDDTTLKQAGHQPGDILLVRIDALERRGPPPKGGSKEQDTAKPGEEKSAEQKKEKDEAEESDESDEEEDEEADESSEGEDDKKKAPESKSSGRK
eukprot:TRINITY_DN7246_c1_g4_i1.p1 TRINITY_DN7246_c1_g4~~TRINITY_DN7246_c1_g4_i1.p1  ORF type:complete len:314 (+),score=91.00 TRINITY_DN7246_c1_g4_i1:77-943(+)